MIRKMRVNDWWCRYWFGWFSACLLSFQAWAAVDVRTLSIDIDGNDMPVEQYVGDPKKPAFVWFPSERGVQEGMRQVARSLAQQGQSVWIIDPFAAFMVPASEQELAKLAVAPFVQLLSQLQQQTTQPMILLSHDRGSGFVLSLAHAWQTAYPQSTDLRAVVLITPNIFVRTPDPGEEGIFLPIAHATNLPVVLLQPSQSPTAMRLSAIVQALQQGGSEVYQYLLADVRDRFFFRPDATDVEQQQRLKLATLLMQISPVITSMDQPKAAVTLAESASDSPSATERRRGLVVYRGKDAHSPPELKLMDLHGQPQQLQQWQGQVVLLNFWASWCPPCLHEMPSMARLAQRLDGQPFQIVAVNLGESPEHIQDFVKRVQVSFPIWLDPDRSSAKAWHVFAYPTSYLIDHLGHIRYAIAGGIEWDQPEVLEKVQQLLTEATQKSSTSAQMIASALERTKWQLHELLGDPLPAQANRPTLELEADKSQVHGFAGCNRFFAQAQWNEQGDFVLQQIGSTMMACAEGMSIEQVYLRTLAQVQHFQIVNHELHLLDAQQQPLMRFVAQPAVMAD